MHKMVKEEGVWMALRREGLRKKWSTSRKLPYVKMRPNVYGRAKALNAWWRARGIMRGDIEAERLNLPLRSWTKKEAREGRSWREDKTGEVTSFIN